MSLAVNLIFGTHVKVERENPSLQGCLLTSTFLTHRNLGHIGQPTEATLKAEIY